MTDELLRVCLPFIVSGLQDVDDDVRAVAAAALIPVTGILTKSYPDQVSLDDASHFTEYFSLCSVHSSADISSCTLKCPVSSRACPLYPEEPFRLCKPSFEGKSCSPSNEETSPPPLKSVHATGNVPSQPKPEKN